MGPEPVRHTIDEDGMESRIAKEYLDGRPRGRIPLKYDPDIFTEFFEKSRHSNQK
jgi:hypothetical protein